MKTNVAMITRMPEAFSVASASSVLALIGSDTASRPAALLSTASSITLAPSARSDSACAFSASTGTPSCVIGAVLPSASFLPATLPCTPMPVLDSNPSALSSTSPRSRAAFTMASANGCSLPWSRLAARRSTSFSANPAAALAVVQTGHLGLQRHAALGTRPRMSLPHFGVHRAGVDGACNCRRGHRQRRRCGCGRHGEVRGWVGCELGLATRTAEVDRRACAFQDMRRPIFDRHAADGVLETFGGWRPGSVVDGVAFMTWVGLHVHRFTPAAAAHRPVNLAPRNALFSGAERTRSGLR
jgi:hypothetical protein